MKKTLALLVASTALTAAIGLPAWSAVHRPAGIGDRPIAAVIDGGTAVYPLVLASDDDDDDDDGHLRRSGYGHDDDDDRDAACAMTRNKNPGIAVSKALTHRTSPPHISTLSTPHPNTHTVPTEPA